MYTVKETGEGAGTGVQWMQGQVKRELLVPTLRIVNSRIWLNGIQATK